MLSYAFSELRKNNYDDIDKEDFEHIEDLFAEILIKAVSLQLKQGQFHLGRISSLTICLSHSLSKSGFRSVFVS